jgi:hypothetical protein
VALAAFRDLMVVDTPDALPVAARDRDPVGRRFRPMPLK